MWEEGVKSWLYFPSTFWLLETYLVEKKNHEARDFLLVSMYFMFSC
jgi:hypothetical protein